LDTLGDKWSLVVIRDMLAGKQRFSEFLASPEGIQRNILAERLKRLENAGLIGRRPYQDKPERFEYCLTARGADLLPILQAMARWAKRHVPGVWMPSEGFFARMPEEFYPPAG
jgi:DNA-binding HxlR family transcriptional regulator